MRTWWRPSTPASQAQSGGTTMIGSAMASTRGTTPGTRRSDPSSPSSPRNAIPATSGGRSTSLATRRPIAIGRSKPAPPLRRLDGAKLTVIRRLCHGSSLELRAARTRIARLAARQVG